MCGNGFNWCPGDKSSPGRICSACHDVHRRATKARWRRKPPNAKSNGVCAALARAEWLKRTGGAGVAVKKGS